MVFSKREAVPPPIQHDVLSPQLRTQVAHIWNDALGIYYGGYLPFPRTPPPTNKLWEAIENRLAREYGVAQLGTSRGRRSDPRQRCLEHLQTAETPQALDIIELSFRAIDTIIRGMHAGELRESGVKQDPDAAIAELNHRFREAGFGYQFVPGRHGEPGALVRVDSQAVHEDVTLPALRALDEEGFRGPLDEMNQALAHHRRGESKDTVTDALNALESVLKTICAKRGWETKGTAGPLIKRVIGKGLLPPELESQFDHLEKLIQSLPDLAHPRGRHGQGEELVEVPDHIAAYILHLLAANTLLLIEAYRAQPLDE